MIDLSLSKVVALQSEKQMGKAAAFSSDASAGEVPEVSGTTKGAVGRSAKKGRGIKYRRRTIELHPDIEGMLDRMQDELRLRSHTEVMQKAIQLLAVVLGEDGGER